MRLVTSVLVMLISLGCGVRLLEAEIAGIDLDRIVERTRHRIEEDVEPDHFVVEDRCYRLELDSAGLSLYLLDRVSPMAAKEGSRPFASQPVLKRHGARVPENPHPRRDTQLRGRG